MKHFSLESTLSLLFFYFGVPNLFAKLSWHQAGNQRGVDSNPGTSAQPLTTDFKNNQIPSVRVLLMNRIKIEKLSFLRKIFLIYN